MNRLRQILTVFLVGLTFFVMQAFGYSTLQAQADDTVESPVGIYYKGTPDETSNVNNNIHNDNKLVESARKNLKETADDVRKSVSKNVGDTVDNVRQSVSKNVGDTVKTPEGVYYKAVPDEDVSSKISSDNDVAKGSKNVLQGVIENVREKLNLDEELPRSTKEFLNSTKETVEETVEPVTQTPEGYYQVPQTGR